MRWNDITEPSLTSEYCDYIQFYRKNHDLSAEAKEKIKNALKIKHDGDCNSLKIIPSEIMEGFYIAKLVKI